MKQRVVEALSGFSGMLSDLYGSKKAFLRAFNPLNTLHLNIPEIVVGVLMQRLISPGCWSLGTF